MAFRGMTVDENNTLGKRVEEAGSYNVRVLPTSELKMSSTGKEMLTLNYEVLDGKYAGGEIRYDNVVWDDTTKEKEEASIKRFNTLMVAAGVPNGSNIATLAMMIKALTTKYNTMNITVGWEGPNKKGYYDLSVQSHQITNSEGSKPNGVMQPPAETVGSNSFGNSAPNPAVDKAAASLPDNFGAPSGDPFASAGQVISDDNLPF